MRRHILAAVALAWGAQAFAFGGQSDAKQDVLVEHEEVIIINGTVVQGQVVLPATETEFRLKLTKTGTIVAFRWADQDPAERR